MTIRIVAHHAMNRVLRERIETALVEEWVQSGGSETRAPPLLGRHCIRRPALAGYGSWGIIYLWHPWRVLYG